MRYVSLLSLAAAGALAGGLLVGLPALARNADQYAQAGDAGSAAGTMPLSQGMNSTNMMGGTGMMGGMMPMMGMMDQMNQMMGNCNAMMQGMPNTGNES